jgi:hypothetical protein
MFTPLSHLSGRIKKRISGLAPHRRAKLAEGAGWAIFLAVLVWFYRIPPWMWATYMPYGAGDMLEALWQIDFWRRAVLTRELQPVITSAMYPLGMHVMTIAHNSEATPEDLRVLSQAYGYAMLALGPALRRLPDDIPLDDRTLVAAIDMIAKLRQVCLAFRREGQYYLYLPLASRLTFEINNSKYNKTISDIHAKS